MKDFHYVTEKGEVRCADYYEKKRETVLETIKPICEAFEIIDYDYLISHNGILEYLAVEGTYLNCTRNSIAGIVKTLLYHILDRL